MAILTELVKDIRLTGNKEPLNIHEDVGKWERAIRKRIDKSEKAMNARLPEIGNLIIR